MLRSSRICRSSLAERLDIPPVYSYSYDNFIQKGGEVYTTVEDRVTGNEVNIKSRHVIACDGARSKVRACLGIETVGEDGCKYLYDCL